MDGTARLNLRLTHYGESHQNPVNRRLHKVCVPAILFSLLGLLQWIPGPIPWELVFIAGSFIYYLPFRSFKVYRIALIQIVPMLFVLSLLGPEKIYVCLVVFVIAWIGQFIGHKIERKKPSFLEDIQYLWIGPIWIFEKH